MVTRILDGNHRAQLQRDGAVVPMSVDFKAVFGDKLDGSHRHLMTFWAS